MRLYHPKGPNSVGVGIPQVHKWVKSVALPKKNMDKSYSSSATIFTYHEWESKP